MATGYVRVSAGQIVTGATIQASHFNNEYNALASFADATTGHNHDGTIGGGAPISVGSLTGLSPSDAGFLAANGSGSLNARSLVAPAEGITITNDDGVSGNPTFALVNDLAAIEALSSTGIAVRTASDTWAQRTIAGTSSRITVTNGDGVSGNPTIDISSSYAGQNTITTVGTVTSGTWSGLFGAVSGANLTNLTAANISAGTAGINITGTAPAGTLTGTTLASGVVTSSLTTVGTIGTGVWQGTVISPVYGGSGIANNVACTTTRSGNFALTQTLTGATNVTYPTTGTLATRGGTETFTNKTLITNSVSFNDNADTTKQIAFDAASATTGTNTVIKTVATVSRTITLPDATTTLVGTDTTQTLSNKTLSSNTVATTQSAGDNSTKLATTAYVDSATSSGGSNSTNDFRLTLTSGTPVTTTDVTGATTVYCCPYKGNKIALYNGTSWAIRTSAQFSLGLGTLTSGLPYDVFCYDNSGTPTLEFLAWTNGTTRATALAYQDGVLVKSGAATRRYLGTFYTTSTTATEDSAQNRYLWNYYNRVNRYITRRETTASWTYSTNSWRQANNSASNQVNIVVGVSEDSLSIALTGQMTNSTSTERQSYSGIAYDGTDPVSAGAYASSGAVSVERSNQCFYSNTPAAGKHFYAWCEQGAVADTQTWYGQSRSGLFGMWVA